MTRILLVEDEDPIRVMFVEALTDAGYEVVGPEMATSLRPCSESSLGSMHCSLTSACPDRWPAWRPADYSARAIPERPIVYVSGLPKLLSQPWPRSKDIVLNKPCTLTQLVSCLDAVVTV